MARTCPAGFNADRLHEEVVRVYDRVARDPGGSYHFHLGMDYAVRLLRYDREELAALPERSTSRFAGVANPHRIERIRPGETVIDIGSGAGTDLLLAALRTGPRGRVVGVDPTPSMRELCRESAAELGLADSVELRDGTADALPVPDGFADVVISNGVLNLSPDKPRVFREIFRGLKPGGRLQLGDVALRTELHEHERANVDLWAGCVGGAFLESEFAELAGEAGFEDVRLVERFSAYRGTEVERTVAEAVGVHGANFIARKPE